MSGVLLPNNEKMVIFLYLTGYRLPEIKNTPDATKIMVEVSYGMGYNFTL